MDIKRQIVRTLMNALPPEEQVVMVSAALNWLFSDCAPAELEKKLAIWIPRLIEDISAGEYGLWLLVFHHLKYLASLHWLRYWFTPMQVPQEDLFARTPEMVSGRATIQEGAK